MARVAVKKRSKNKVTDGVIYINASFNNTIITITDLQGNTLCWASAGHCGFKGSRKGTSFAGQDAVATATNKAKEQFGLARVKVVICGPGQVRDPGVRVLISLGIEVTSIKDVTPIPHNGCRRRKKRRM
ncbi:MAG: 30S ribosomal protein S11 [Gammaproteobacteria bacterium]|nr:30S ribosomal protein S11 [Gammaproteobacteria bacterium]MBY0544472.1 30S ribosomal protein S11 [Gammaproteobacteria bacterium]